jgi:DNA mismatch repair protein MutS2
VAGLGLRGQLRALFQNEAEVDVRNKRLRVPLSDLQTAPDSEGATARGRITASTSTSSALASELNVIGCTADEALARAERYLDQAVLHEQRQVRIIHGRGTGVLQRSIAGMLAAHPQVDRFAPAQREQGGDGVTVIELRD